MTRHKKAQATRMNETSNQVMQHSQHEYNKKEYFEDQEQVFGPSDPNRSHHGIGVQEMDDNFVTSRGKRIRSIVQQPQGIIPYHVQYPLYNSETMESNIGRARQFSVMDAESLMHSPQHLLPHEILASNILNHCHSQSARISRDYVPTNLEYSGTSDSGGEIVATPPTASRRFGIGQCEGPMRRSPPSVRASSGEDFDVDPYMETVFRRVTVKKRRQETRQIFDKGAAGRPRRSTRLTQSLRVAEVSRRVTPSAVEPDALESLAAGILQPDSDDYRLVFISSEDSSSKEEEEEEGEGSHSEDADADSSSSSSTAPGLALDECDWD